MKFAVHIGKALNLLATKFQKIRLIITDFGLSHAEKQQSDRIILQCAFLRW